MISANLAVRVLDHFSFNITNYIAFCFTIGFCWTSRFYKDMYHGLFFLL